MMKTMLRRIGVCTLLILVAGTVVVAKDWRGITLLKSTREDVERLNNDFLRGTIQVLGPNKKVRQTMMKSAARAKRYLVKEREFEAERLLIVDGGFSERALTRLSIHTIGGPVGLIYLFPEKDP